jgi:hypothetical protein
LAGKAEGKSNREIARNVGVAEGYLSRVEGLSVYGWRAPQQEVYQPLSRGGEAFRPATVEPGRQAQRLIDDLPHLAQQNLGDLNVAIIAGLVEGRTDLVQKAALLLTFDYHGRHLSERYQGEKIRITLST